MIKFCIFGSGRMGDVYGKILANHQGADLVAVINPNLPSARRVTDQYGGKAFVSWSECIEEVEVGAVIVCSPTNSHLEHIKQVANSNKPIFCEKPVDLSIDRVDECIAVIEKNQIPFFVGFNRRFDPTNAALKKRVSNGEVGNINMVILTSRDPAPPPIEYIKRSGGYFCDSTIHDIDLACWIIGETPVEVYASSSCLVDKRIGEAGDVDTSMTILKMPSGILCHINNSRRAVYGFDQRVEVFGSSGMLQTNNQYDVNLSVSTDSVTDAKTPLKHFFLERYEQSFIDEIDEFINCLKNDNPVTVTISDGRKALEIALACEQSRQTGMSVKLD